MFPYAVFITLLQITVCAADVPNVQAPEKRFEAIAKDDDSNPSQIVSCNTIVYQYCQIAFNTNLNLDPVLTWRNGTKLMTAIRQKLSKTMADLLNVCRARTLFSQCLAGYYDYCMNRYHLIGQQQTDLRNIFDFLHIFSQLRFICTAGFEEVVNQWSCIYGATTLQSYQNCQTQFDTVIQERPSELCSALKDFMICAQKIVSSDSSCGNKAAAWWICEDTRIGYAEDCKELRCYVNLEL